MKNIVIFYFALSSISLVTVVMFVSMFLFNTPSNPMNYLIFVIVFTILMSIITFIEKPYLTIYSYMILMIMISGMMVMLSYFVSMVNLNNKDFKKIKLIFIITYLYVFLMTYLSYLINKCILVKKFSVVHENSWCSLMKMFNYPNYYIFAMIVIFMVLMLLVCSKICISKKGSLRGKKF